MSPTSVLLVIDVQNDFLPGGALAVPDGDGVIAPILALAERFEHVILTQDWHPAGHVSFASSHPGKRPFETITLPDGRTQVLWPDHCVQGSHGAELAGALKIPKAEMILRKGFRSHIDSYSAFAEADGATPTGLTGYLRERGFTRVFLTGLALDFCVSWSALDAKRAGFETFVIPEAARSIDTGGSLEAAIAAMYKAGVHLADGLLAQA
ncbi:MAG: bifunctional nicotinamidase/pyrazinamidase [Beijerinckiaceae bacterium]|jgi:nicotinamidase/pyrazinamidase